MKAILELQFAVAGCTLLIASSSLAQDAEDGESKQTGNPQTSRGLSIEDIRTGSSAVFEFLDANSNGLIEVEELWSSPENESRRAQARRSAAVRIGFAPSRSKVDVFDASDTDKDGLLSKSEYEQRESSVRKFVLREAHSKLDSNEDGEVDLKEFNSRVDSLAKWDSNEDGVISRSEIDREFWVSAQGVPGFRGAYERRARDLRLRNWRSRRK